MTDQPGTRWNPLAAPAPHGHRKMSRALAVYATGQAAGQDILRFAWDNAAGVLNHFWTLSIQPMPEDLAANIFGLLSLLAAYQTEEK